MLENLKKYKFILINKNDLDAKEFSSSYVVFFSLCLFLLFFSIISLTFFSSDLNRFITFKTINKHKANNKELHSIILDQEKQINNLLNEIDEISQRDENLRKLIKLPSIEKDVRKLGVGGTSDDDKLNNLQYLLPENFDLNLLKDKVDYIIRSVNLENLSYNEIESQTKDNLDDILHFPAIYPISRDNSKFSSGFGYRVDPFTKKKKLHEGHDFSAKYGTDVICTADGVVKSSRRYGSFGNFIEVTHGNGFITAYGHLSKRLVKKGDKVERGQVIGRVGSTGKSTAPHLHYEIRHNKKHIDPTEFYFNKNFSDS